MQMEGLPTHALLSTSLSRPSLQVLKLAPCFLWQPFDVYKVMEFVNLPVIPLDDALARLISATLAEKPGFDSELWFARVQSYLDEAPPEVTDQYKTLFKRRRYASDTAVPRREALELFQWLSNWANERLATDGGQEFRILATQAYRICDLLDALPDARLTFLELEHVIRTVYEPTPIGITPDCEQPYQITTEPGAVCTAVDRVLWWNCTDMTSTPHPDFWTEAEMTVLAQQNVKPDAASLMHQLDKALQLRPILRAGRQLVIVLPEQVAGQEVIGHPLMSLMESAFKDLSSITYQIEQPDDLERLKKHFITPTLKQIEVVSAKVPDLFIEANADLQVFEENKDESFTHLESLLYYPHIWFFQKQMALRSARILDIKADYTLLGNLAHRFFEALLPHPDLSKLTKDDLNLWIQEHELRFLEQEGATLLLYGREIERQQFMHVLRRSIFVFVQMLQNNGWRVQSVEQNFSGKVGHMPIRCRTDVILTRGDELCILDLKWAGATKRSAQIQNGEDIQLITYARTLPPDAYWPHTGFYIISDAKLLMRNRLAFDNATTPGKPTDESREEIAQQIFDRLEATLAWRLQQISEGRVEVRTSDTFQELEDLYAADLHDLLNLPRESSKYDSFGTLLYGV
jgi:PD-(D/E)XK nuclease superfamily